MGLILAQTIGALGADGSWVVAAFGLDQCSEQELPVVGTQTNLAQGTVPLVAISSRPDQGEDVVASGRRRGDQRGQNHFGLSAIIQPRPGRPRAVESPARGPGRAVATEGDDVSRAPRG